jgi:hypothetical protein
MCIDLSQYNFDKLIGFNFFDIFCLYMIFESDPYHSFDKGSYLYKWNFRKELPLETGAHNCNVSGCGAYELSTYSANCDCLGLLSTETVEEVLPSTLKFYYTSKSSSGTSTSVTINLICSNVEMEADVDVVFDMY